MEEASSVRTARIPQAQVRPASAVGMSAAILAVIGDATMANPGETPARAGRRAAARPARPRAAAVRRRQGRGGRDRPPHVPERVPAADGVLRPQDRPRAAHPARGRRGAEVVRRRGAGPGADRLRAAVRLGGPEAAAAALPRGGDPLLRRLHPALLPRAQGGAAPPGVRLLRLGGDLQPDDDRAVLVVRERGLLAPRGRPAVPADRDRLDGGGAARRRAGEPAVRPRAEPVPDDGARRRAPGGAPRPLPRDRGADGVAARPCGRRADERPATASRSC